MSALRFGRNWKIITIIFFGVIIAALTLTVTSMAWGMPFSGMQRYEKGAKTTYEIYGSKGELVKRYTAIDPTGDPNHHTLKFTISGSRMQGIKITNMDMKVAPGDTIFKIAADATKFIYTDKVVFKNIEAGELEIKNSEIGDIVLSNVLADGASTNVDAAAPPLSRRGFSNYESLPVWSVDASKYDVIEIIATTDATVIFFTFDTIKIPGEALVDRLRANTLEVKDSIIGDGDGRANKDFVFTNVKSNKPGLTGVDESQAIDVSR